MDDCRVSAKNKSIAYNPTSERELADNCNQKKKSVIYRHNRRRLIALNGKLGRVKLHGTVTADPG